MLPGEYFVGTGLERPTGTALRDTILILLPGPRLLPVFLRRANLDGTVAETVLKHGTGGLNIDACRVTAAGPSPSIKHRLTAQRTGNAPIPGSTAAEATANGRIERRGSTEAYTVEHPGESLGRWPPNLLLVHGPGCLQAGTRKVASHNPDNRSMDRTTKDAYGVYTSRSLTGHASPDRTETIPSWDCEPGCPVGMLDEMSGNLRARGNVSATTGGGGLYGHPIIPRPGNVGDAGTASRFFPQFTSLDEALAWIDRLIGARAG